MGGAWRAGFTLIEVLAVLFLTALVFGVALDFYIDLTNQSHYASEATREIRRATTLLDRLARDFEHALLVQKPEETDPLDHPWVFLAERRRSESGADRVKFVARQEPDRRAAANAGVIATVAYLLRPDPYGEAFELVRWSRPDVPEGLDREFPQGDDPDALMLADGIDHFGLRFLGEDGEWVEEWDSSQLLDSSELPRAVEIELALSSVDPRTGEPRVSPTYRRRVMLPVRPLDMQTLLDPEAYAALGGGSSQGDQDCQLRVADCIDMSLVGGAAGAAAAAQGGGGDAGLSALLKLSREERDALRQLNRADISQACWDELRPTFGNHPAVRPHCR